MIGACCVQNDRGFSRLFRFVGVTGFDFEPDGGAFEAEGGADLVLEEALEGEMQLDVAVGEEDEGGRGDGGLRHVEDADALRHGYWCALEIDLVEKAIHLSGGDALAAFGCESLDLFKDAFHPFAFFRR